ncbi:MAG: sugar ABC transporter permease [Eubacteriales bacterium]|nr:sugar ABC transporter permease [Eubacteriales bacterium]
MLSKIKDIKETFREAKHLTEKKSKRFKLSDIIDNRVNYYMLAPFFIFFLFFTVLPILSSAGISFSYFNMLQTPKFIGFTNYLKLFLDDDIFLIAIRNTLLCAFITGPIGYFACLFFAWLINDLPKKLRVLMTFVFYAPSISGNLFVVWAFIFSGDQYGMINSVFMRLGISKDPVQFLTNPEYALTVVIIVQIWMSLGASFLAFMAGFQNIDSDLYEAGAIDGIRNRWQEFFFLTLPAMGPQLLFGAVMTISSSFSIGAVAATLTGMPSVDYSTHTIISHIQDFGLIRFELGYASAISVVLFIVILLTNFIIRAIINAYTGRD